MDYNVIFSEKPTVAPWGNNMSIVPINIREFQNIDEEGELVTMWMADLVKKVVNPVTVDSIVEAAVDDKYTEAEQKYIMRNIDNDSDPLVKEYKAFVKEIGTQAKEAGYK